LCYNEEKYLGVSKVKLSSDNETLAENKILILYILDKLYAPIDNSNLYRIILSTQDMNYFYYQQFLLDLIQLNYIKGYKKDFQSWKGIVTLKLLCCNIAAGRFDWKKYCTPQPYCGQEICVIPLHCSYGQIGYTVYFPYSDMPEVEYDWEMNKLTIDKESWENYLQN